MYGVGSAMIATVIVLVCAAPGEAADGSFDRGWGRDVASAGPGNTGNGFEICLAGVDICKAGVPGELGGDMDQPHGVATDPAGNVYVADRSNDRIQKFGPSGNFQRAWGRDVASAGPGNTGNGFEICVAGVDTCKAGIEGGLGGEMSSPNGVATDSAGNVYVADAANNRIQKFDSQGNFLRTWGKDVASFPAGADICAAASLCQAGGVGGLAGEMSSPAGVATDSAGNVYVADSSPNHRIQKFSSTGSFERAWGKDVVSAGPGNTGTGFEICAGAATCKAGENGALGGEMTFPLGVATDSAANVYVADSSNSRIQKFNSSGAFVRAWGKDVASAGPNNTGTGFEICVPIVDTCKAGQQGGLAGEMAGGPFGVATDPAGNVYVTDRLNDRIQRFSFSGGFQRAWGKDVASAGPGNTGTGFEICVAGVDTCKAGVSGELGGEMNDPRLGIATDSAGNVYLAEQFSNRIQKFADPAQPGGGPVPSNAFTIGKLKGRRLSVTVFAAGTVEVNNAGAAKGALAAAKRQLKRSSASGGPGTIKVKLRLTKRAVQKLRRTGKVKLRTMITFTPNGGTPNSKAAKLKIKTKK
jgi:DNA-binding beta-propeller fold protein YncE